MPPKRREFRRLLGERRYKRLFIIATEGNKTEPRYFDILNRMAPNAHVIHVPGGHASSPPQVLKRMKEYIERERPELPYEAWLIVDKDSWNAEQLDLLHRWEQQRDNYGLAISHPKFEYWLLLHFEDGRNVKSTHQCFSRLQQHLPNYRKDADLRKITSRIDNAISRAEERDNTTSKDWLPTFGSTTVYRLVRKILESG